MIMILAYGRFISCSLLEKDAVLFHKDIDPDKSAYKLFLLLGGMSLIAQVTKGTYPIDMTMMTNEIIENHYAAKL